MTWNRGLFVNEDATRGTTPVEARLALAGLFGQVGILSGLTVSGTAGWAYSVAAGALVTNRASGDGAILFANDGAVSFTTIAAPGTGSRWDVLWVKHNDVDNADADSAVSYGVVNGTSSGSPSVPSIPSGAFELGRALVPTGAANTNAGTVSITSSTVRAELVAPSTAWVSITVAGTFAAYSDPPQVQRIGKRVYARGGWTSTGMSASTAHTVGTVPAGYRPAKQARGLHVSTTNGNSGGRVLVATDGTITLTTQGTVGAWTAFPDGMSWEIP